MASLSLYELYMRACRRPWETDVGPIRMAPHCWYVGDEYVGVMLVETKDGIVLLDASVFGQTYMVFEAVRKLGYDPQKDIKLCLLTHAHLDHCGGMGIIQNYAHPVMYMSPLETDWPKKPETYYAKYIDEYTPYTVDRVYDYEKPIEHGGYSFRVVHTPGHTVGTSSFFFEDTDEKTGVTYRIGMHGGLGLNTLVDSCFTTAEGAHAARDQFRKQLLEWRDIPVDITITSHPSNIGMELSAIVDKSDYSQFADRQIWIHQIEKKLEELKQLERESVFQ